MALMLGAAPAGTERGVTFARGIGRGEDRHPTFLALGDGVNALVNFVGSFFGFLSGALSMTRCGLSLSP